jgi:hypothetical protein
MCTWLGKLMNLRRIVLKEKMEFNLGGGAHDECMLIKISVLTNETPKLTDTHSFHFDNLITWDTHIELELRR